MLVLPATKEINYEALLIRFVFLKYTRTYKYLRMLKKNRQNAIFNARNQAALKLFANL